MTDKEKIIQEIERRIHFLDRMVNTDLGRGSLDTLNEVLDFINSLPAEQQSEDMEEAFDEVLPNPNWYISNDGEDAYNVKQMEEMFCAGSQWQKEQMMKSAVSIGYLQDWYQNSIDGEVPPIWTDEHLNELTKDFYLIPKQKEDEQ